MRNTFSSQVLIHKKKYNTIQLMLSRFAYNINTFKLTDGTLKDITRLSKRQKNWIYFNQVELTNVIHAVNNKKKIIRNYCSLTHCNQCVGYGEARESRRLFPQREGERKTKRGKCAIHIKSVHVWRSHYFGVSLCIPSSNSSPRTALLQYTAIQARHTTKQSTTRKHISPACLAWLAEFIGGALNVHAHLRASARE